MKPVLSRIRHFSQSNSALARITRNVSWTTIERALRLPIGLAITSLLARHLGPEDFGLLSLGIAIISIMIPFTELGLQGVVIKSHVDSPEKTGEIVGTVFGLRIVGALVSAALAIAVAFLYPSTGSQLLILVALLSFTPMFRTSDSFRHIFEARVFARPPIIAEIVASLTANVIRLIAIIGGLSVFSFALIHSIEFAIAGAFIIATYRYHIGRLSDLSFSFSRALELLRLAWPLLLSSIAVVIYMKIDQLMLGAMLGKAEVGIYSLAVRISEMWYFIAGAIVWSTFPFLVEAKKEDPNLYAHRLQRLLKTLILIAIGTALLLSLISHPLISLLFGDAYAEASDVLVIHAWGGIFAVLAMVTRYWAINENLQKLDLVRTISGALINIALNFLWIPKFGIIGATYATLLSHIWSGLLFDILMPQTRGLFRAKMRSFLFFSANERRDVS